ncbi:hypothetical protein [Sphingomonas phage Birtae]|nr:hypothetical protein [Sphingomonas phage Birtae]
MSLRGTFKTDKTKEVEGVEIPVGMNDHNKLPITIRISRMSRSNKRYTKALEEATRPHSSAINNETLDNEIGSRILQEVFVDTVLLGWGNLPKSDLTGNDEDTDELPFSRENALALFEELPDLYDDWESRAKKASTFRESERSKSAKN